MHMDVTKIKCKFIVTGFCFLTSTLSYAIAFNITPKTGTTLPTTVPAGGVAYAYYTVA